MDKLFSLKTFLGITTLLAFGVIVLGAYTRLTDAGLGCPDWPGCYGQLKPALSQLPNSLTPLSDLFKAWTEMIHRYFAGLLGILIFTLPFLTRHAPKPIRHIALLTSLLVILQALLGMWTVTLKLLPVVVMAHLLGGFLLLSLLWWLNLSLHIPHKEPLIYPLRLKRYTFIALLLLAFQIFLGGWTSSNYAALVCLDFPGCHKILSSTPHTFFGLSTAFSHWQEAFNLTQSTPRSYAALTTIHMLHRIGAVLVTLLLLGIIRNTLKKANSLMVRKTGFMILFFLILQVLLGITNVIAVLPLPVAVLHNATAALLWLSVLTLYYL